MLVATLLAAVLLLAVLALQWVAAVQTGPRPGHHTGRLADHRRGRRMEEAVEALLVG